jgi:hypothetical protein
MIEIRKRFKAQSQQSLETKKWIAAGRLHDFEGIVTQVSFDDKFFETEEEADKYFSEYCMNKDYIKI